MVILALALTGVLRCFTNGLKSISYDKRMTQAILLGQGLLEDFETEVPEEKDAVEGDFGPDFPGFSYSAEFERVEIKYRDLDAALALRKKNLEPLQKVTLRVYHQPPSATKAVCLLELETYLTGIEKYAPITKNTFGLF